MTLKGKRERKTAGKIARDNPEIERDDINAVLYSENEIYFGGRGIFGKINDKGRLVKIVSETDRNLTINNESLFYILFDGNIYELERSSEFYNLITFTSNNSGLLSVSYNPERNEFYLAPRLVKKAFKLTQDNKVIETEIPEFDKENFEWWHNKYKIF